VASSLCNGLGGLVLRHWTTEQVMKMYQLIINLSLTINQCLLSPMEDKSVITIKAWMFAVRISST